MYFGEVSIAQDELNSFLAVAEELQIKGLTQDSNCDNSESNRNRTVHMNKKSTQATSKDNFTRKLVPIATETSVPHSVVTDPDDDIVPINVKMEASHDTDDTAGDGIKYDDGEYDNSYYDEGAAMEFDSSSGIINSKGEV